MGFLVYTEYVMGKKVVQKQQEDKRRQVPLKVFEPNTALRGACSDCGRERIEYVNGLVKAARLGNVSIDDLTDILGCKRQGCDGRISFEVDDER